MGGVHGSTSPFRGMSSTLPCRLCLLPVDVHSPRCSASPALRLLRLVTALPKLQLFVGALLKSFSAIGYVGLLLGLLFYIYAVAGVHFFSATRA